MEGRRFNIKNIIYGVIFVGVIIFSFVWTSQKEGFFVDELFSYGLSNSYYVPFIQQKGEYINTYHSGEEIFQYLTVSDEDAFQFGSVWYNQSQDVHPPFYYALIHLVSSVFKETISPWIGIGVNYVFYILSMFLFFSIAKELCYEKRYAIIASVFFGISVGTINCLMFIRMYMMLLFWILLYTRMMIGFFKQERPLTKKHYIFICLVIICGFLTHYHFIIPAVILSGLYVMYLQLNKKTKDILYYVITCVAAAIGTQLIFGASFKHIFYGYRGVEAFDNAMNESVFVRVGKMWGFVDQQLFGGCFWVIAISIIVAIVYICFKHRNEISLKKELENEALASREPISIIRWSIGITTLISFVLISKTAAYITARYLFGIYPLIILTVVFVIDYIDKYFKHRCIKYIVSILLIIGVILSYTVQEEPSYLYEDNAVVPNIIEEKYAGTNAIYVTDISYQYVSDSYALSMHDEIYIADYKTIDNLGWFDKDNQILLYVNEGALDPDNLERVNTIEDYISYAKNAGYSSCQYIGNTEFSVVYVLTRTE
ncbi:MAG: hypothetical protein IKJ73_08660 [Lachnospiraceae bacterium]|nr:hypothetical protein [Lachnospiraceae bacterium]